MPSPSVSSRFYPGSRICSGWRRGLALWLVIASTLAAPSPAFAAGPSAGKSAKEGTAGKRERAHALYERSKEAYKAGEFSEAAELLEQAYELFPIPVLLYNLARAKESAGDGPGAVSAYHRYLDSDAQIEDRVAIERRIATLEEQLREAERAEQERRRALARAKQAELAAKQAERERAAQPASGSPWPWVVLGTGAATLIAGGVFGVLARKRESAAADAESQVAAQDAFEQGERYASLANVLFAVGGAVTVAGSVWLGVDLLAAAPEATTATRSPRRQGGRGALSLRLGGSF